MRALSPAATVGYLAEAGTIRRRRVADASPTTTTPPSNVRQRRSPTTRHRRCSRPPRCQPVPGARRRRCCLPPGSLRCTRGWMTDLPLPHTTSWELSGPEAARSGVGDSSPRRVPYMKRLFIRLRRTCGLNPSALMASPNLLRHLCRLTLNWLTDRKPTLFHRLRSRQRPDRESIVLSKQRYNTRRSALATEHGASSR